MNNIRRFRKERGFSIKQLADRAGIVPSYVFNLEMGNRTNPSKDVMEKIATALDKSVIEVFFNGEQQEVS